MVSIEKEIRKYKVVDKFDTIYHSYDDYGKAVKLMDALSRYHSCRFFIKEKV
jgi:hypothetical protein